jgi:cytochrome c oxidase assembly protein subunit 11
VNEPQPLTQPPTEPAAARRAGTWKLGAVVVAMFGFGFAMVPMYGAICRLTGLNGKNSSMKIAESVQQQVDLTRTVKVQFLTTVNGGRIWKFGAQQSELDVHPGQLYKIYFDAQNQQDAPVVGQAVFSAVPWSAARYVHKTECFCFSQQIFAANEDKRMPVTFRLDANLPADIDTVTFSYTMFDVTTLAQQEQAAAGAERQAPAPAKAAPAVPQS